MMHKIQTSMDIEDKAIVGDMVIQGFADDAKMRLPDSTSGVNKNVKMATKVGISTKQTTDRTRTLST